MWWHYLLVFVGALLFDIVPFPFLPAFTIMMFLQLIYDLDVWWVIIIGVLGSVMGRYILLLYAPLIGNRYLKSSKNKDIQFLGEKMNENRWKGQLFIIAIANYTAFSGSWHFKIKTEVYYSSLYYWKVYKRHGYVAVGEIRLRKYRKCY